MKLTFKFIYCLTMSENSSFSISQWLKSLLELFNIFKRDSKEQINKNLMLNECDETYPTFFAGSFWY